MVAGRSWAIQDWLPVTIGAHNLFMTIKHANGAVCDAVLLTHEEYEIRAIEAGSDDVQVFTRVKGTWFSAEIEPVAITFEWQRVGAATAPSVEDCICPKELAAHVIQTLLAGCEEGKSSESLYLFNPQGHRVAIRESDLFV